MKTILILAGQSRRFWPLSQKPLFPVCGKMLLEHQIDRLKKAKCTDILLVASPENAGDVQARFPKIPMVLQKEGTIGMHHALLAALPKCGKESVLVVSGNDFFDPSAYATLIVEAKKKGIDGALLAQRVTKYFPGGYLTVKDGRIKGIVEKPGEGKEPSDLVNIVAHVHNDASVLLAALKKVEPDIDDGYERALDSLLKTRHYRAVPYTGMWQAVKHPWHILSLLPLLLADIKKPSVHKTAKIHKSAVIEGNVIIEEGVRVLPHATIVGPCYIGKGSIIGNNALVRGSSVGEKCVVGYSSEVKGSVLAGPVWTHMTYLGDSVIGRNVSFGGGCVTGNLRLDEGEISTSAISPSVDTQNLASASPLSLTSTPTGMTKLGAIVGDDCRLGIQVGMNPGVRIGWGSFIGGGIFLSQDLPAGSFATMKDGKLSVRPNRSAPPSMEERKKYFR